MTIPKPAPVDRSGAAPDLGGRALIGAMLMTGGVSPFVEGARCLSRAPGLPLGYLACVVAGLAMFSVGAYLVWRSRRETWPTPAPTGPLWPTPGYGSDTATGGTAPGCGAEGGGGACQG